MTTSILSDLALGIGAAAGLLGVRVAVEALDRAGDWNAGALPWVGGRTDPAERARQAYVREEISETELERRLELALDDRNSRIRQWAERIDGVGPATSADLALRFESIGDIIHADRSELLDIHGIGPETADAIESHVERTATPNQDCARQL